MSEITVTPEEATELKEGIDSFLRNPEEIDSSSAQKVIDDEKTKRTVAFLETLTTTIYSEIDSSLKLNGLAGFGEKLSPEYMAKTSIEVLQKRLGEEGMKHLEDAPEYVLILGFTTIIAQNIIAYAKKPKLENKEGIDQ